MLDRVELAISAVRTLVHNGSIILDEDSRTLPQISALVNTLEGNALAMA